jgi:hypothetical protein
MSGEKELGAMRFAYADPPYLGCGRMYVKHHPEALIWDDPETHRRLIERLSDEWPDGWALSLHVPSLRTLLPMCPPDVRVGSACKTFAQIRPTRVQWFWEPVIWRGGRKTRVSQSPRDWLQYNTAPRSAARDGGLIGGKPMAYCLWVFSLLGAERGDTLDDLFPGTGAVTAAWKAFQAQPLSAPPLPLEALA